MTNFLIINRSTPIQKYDMPIPATVQLALGDHGSDGKNLHFLTEQLASNIEIDEAIDRIVKNLESSRNKAKKILKAENEKLRLIEPYTK